MEREGYRLYTIYTPLSPTICKGLWPKTSKKTSSEY